MLKSRSTPIAWMWIACLLGLAVLRGAGPTATLADDPVAPPAATAAVPAGEQEPRVSLSAAESSVSWDSRLVESPPFDLPVVVLHNEGRASREADRTLTIRISGMDGGAAVQIQALSWHEKRSAWEENLQLLPPDSSLASGGEDRFRCTRSGRRSKGVPSPARSSSGHGG